MINILIGYWILTTIYGVYWLINNPSRFEDKENFTLMEVIAKIFPSMLLAWIFVPMGLLHQIKFKRQNMKIKDLKKWISDISSEFDEYTITHREYYDSEEDTLFANEVPIVSVHIDDNEMKACFMHEQSYLLYKGDSIITKFKVSSTKVDCG